LIAKEIGLTIPQSMLYRADKSDQVISKKGLIGVMTPWYLYANLISGGKIHGKTNGTFGKAATH
jgi:hypothetical protein